MGRIRVLIWIFIISGWLLSGNALAQKESDTCVYLSHHLSSGILNIETSQGLIQVSAITSKALEVKSFPGNLPKSDTSSLIIKSQNPVQTVEEQPTWLLLKTEDITVAFHKNPFYMAFVFKGDTLLKEQDGTFGLTKRESLYGLGNIDFPLKQMSYSLKNGEIKNNSVPIIISSKKYLLVFDSPKESYLNVDSDKMKWVRPKGVTKFYFVADTDFKDLFNQRGILLGNPEKPPRNMSCEFPQKQTGIDDLINRYGFVSIKNDSSYNWNSLQSLLPEMLNMGLSGFPYFVFDDQKLKTDRELYNRWSQLASFSSVLANDTGILRDALFPYIYTLSAQATIKGYPLVRPLFVEFPDDDNSFSVSSEYMFGPQLLVAPVLKKKQTMHSVYLPKGSKWYYFYSNRKFPGGNEYDLPVTLSDIPLFVRAGSFLPMVDTSRLVNDCSTQNLIIRYYMSSTDNRESFLMYEDNGEPDAIPKGKFETLMLMQKADVRGNPTFMFSKVKGYKGMPASRNIKLEIVGLQQVKKLILFRDDVEMKKKKPGKQGEGYYFDKERKLWVVEFNWGMGDVILSTKQKK